MAQGVPEVVLKKLQAQAQTSTTAVLALSGQDTKVREGSSGGGATRGVEARSAVEKVLEHHRVVTGAVPLAWREASPHFSFDEVLGGVSAASPGHPALDLDMVTRTALPPGWSWADEWRPFIDRAVTDHDGWSYFSASGGKAFPSPEAVLADQTGKTGKMRLKVKLRRRAWVRVRVREEGYSDSNTSQAAAGGLSAANSGSDDAPRIIAKGRSEELLSGISPHSLPPSGSTAASSAERIGNTSKGIKAGQAHGVPSLTQALGWLNTRSRQGLVQNFSVLLLPFCPFF